MTLLVLWIVFLLVKSSRAQEYDAWLGNEYETTWFWKIYAKESVKGATGDFGAVSGYIGGATIADPFNLFNAHDLETVLIELSARDAVQDASLSNIASRLLGSNLLAITAEISTPGNSITHTITELQSGESIYKIVDAHCGIRIPPGQWTLSSSHGEGGHVDTVSTVQNRIWFESGYELSMLLQVESIPYIPEPALNKQGIYHDIIARPQNYFQSRGMGRGRI